MSETYKALIQIPTQGYEVVGTGFATEDAAMDRIKEVIGNYGPTAGWDIKPE